MLTLNQIHAQIVALANAHFQIAEVGMGTIAELQGKPDRLYPLLWLSNEGGSLEDNYKVDNIRLTMFGRVIAGEEGQDDDASEIEVLSDMQLILLDFLNYFHQQHGQEYVTDKAATLEHFTERTNDRTAGYSCVLELKQFYDWNKCQIPQSGASIPPTVDGLTLYDFCDQSVLDRLTPTQEACLIAEFGNCDDATVENSDASYSTTVASGDTLVLPDTPIKANGSLVINQPSTIEKDIVVRYETQGLVGSVVAGEIEIPDVVACEPSLSVGLSDSTPNFLDTVTITATPTGITPTGYTFTITGGSQDDEVYQQASNVLAWENWREGVVTIHVTATDGTDSAGIETTLTSTFVWANNVDCDGSNDSIGSTTYNWNNPTTKEGGGESISIRFKLNATGRNGKYLFIRGATSGVYYQALFYSSTNQLRVLMDPSVTVNIPFVQDTGWHILTVARNTSAYEVYFDGASIASGAIGLATPKYTSALTSISRLGGLSGRMRDIWFWDRKLTASEVTQLGTATVGGVPRKRGLIMGIRPTDSIGTTTGNLTDISNDANLFPMNNFVAPYGVVANV